VNRLIIIISRNVKNKIEIKPPVLFFLSEVSEVSSLKLSFISQGPGTIMAVKGQLGQSYQGHDKETRKTSMSQISPSRGPRVTSNRPSTYFAEGSSSPRNQHIVLLEVCK
jgi:hypothetical protein